MKRIFIVDYENTSMYGLLGVDRLDENSIVRIHCSKENLPEKYKSHLLSTIKKSNSEKEFREKATRIFGKKQEKLIEISVLYFNKLKE